MSCCLWLSESDQLVQPARPRRRKLWFSFSRINELISLDMHTTAEQRKAKYHAAVGAGSRNTGDGFRLTWTAKLCTECSHSNWFLGVWHFTCEVEEGRSNRAGKYLEMCHKWRMPLITSVSHYHPPDRPTIPCAVPNTKSKLQAEIWNKDGQVLLQGVGTS